MQQSRLCSILRQLSTKERTKFTEFVHSPYFNKNEKVHQLWALIAPYAPDFEHPELDRKQIFISFLGQLSIPQATSITLYRTSFTCFTIFYPFTNGSYSHNCAVICY